MSADQIPGERWDESAKGGHPQASRRRTTAVECDVLPRRGPATDLRLLSHLAD